jgi:hypothetical protein
VSSCLGGKDSLDDLKNIDLTHIYGIGFSFKIDFEAALAFRRARGEYLRAYQYEALEVEVYIL